MYIKEYEVAFKKKKAKEDKGNSDKSRRNNAKQQVNADLTAQSNHTL